MMLALAHALGAGGRVPFTPPPPPPEGFTYVINNGSYVLKDGAYVIARIA